MSSSARWAHRAGSGSGSSTTSASRATDRAQQKGGAAPLDFSDPVFSLLFFSWGAHAPPSCKKKGCSKAALRDLQCYQRLKTYIVTSKPKRISVYSGLLHMVRLLQRVNPLHRGSTAASSRPWIVFCCSPITPPYRKTLKSGS